MTESDPAAHPTVKIASFEPLGINPHGLPMISPLVCEGFYDSWWNSPGFLRISQILSRISQILRLSTRQDLDPETVY